MEGVTLSPKLLFNADKFATRTGRELVAGELLFQSDVYDKSEARGH